MGEVRGESTGFKVLLRKKSKAESFLVMSSYALSTSRNTFTLFTPSSYAASDH